MEPFPDAMAYIELSFTVTKASILISTSDRLPLPTQNGFNAFLRELTWLKTLLRTIAKDSDIVAVFPQTFQRYIAGVVANCELVLAGVQRVLGKHIDNGTANNTKWVLTGVEDIAKVRLHLEGRRPAHRVPLEAVTLSITTDTKVPVQDLHGGTAAIDSYASNIVDEITRLRDGLGVDDTIISLLTIRRPSIQHLVDISEYDQSPSTPLPALRSEKKQWERPSPAALYLEKKQWERLSPPISLDEHRTHIEPKLQPSASLPPPRFSAFKSGRPRSPTPSPKVRFADVPADNIVPVALDTESANLDEPHPNHAIPEAQLAGSDHANELEYQMKPSWTQPLNRGRLFAKADNDRIRSHSAPVSRHATLIAQRTKEVETETPRVRIEKQRVAVMPFGEIRHKRRDSAANSLSQKSVSICSDDNSAPSLNDRLVPSWTNAVDVDGQEPYPVTIAGFDCTWAVRKTIGSGSRATVNICEHQRSGQLAAVKIYKRTRQRDGFLPDKRLNREITLLSLLNHPHIVEYQYSGQTGQYQYILLDHVSNGTLSNYCATTKGLEEKQVRKFARQIGSALLYCHTNLIIHGSLNAEKVLITSAGNVKIAGFGSSTFSNGRDFEVDTAAYGILIWNMMSSERPIQFEDVLRKELSPPKSWGCYSLLQNLLHKDSEQRHDLKMALDDPWMLVGHSGPVQSFVPPRAPPATPLSTSVIQKINDLGIRSLSEELNDLLNSPEYRTAVSEWRKRKRGPVASRKRGLLDFISKDKPGKDNTESFHAQFDLRNHLSIPALAVYYLVQEKNPLGAQNP